MVNILVCMKHVLDVAQIKTDTDTNEPILTGVPRKMSDFDKNALEEAVKIKESLGGTIKTITMGDPAQAMTNVREALAVGGDEAFILDDPLFEEADSFQTASVIASAIEKIGEYDLILCGEASIDNYAGQVGPRIAEILDIPQITYVKKLTVDEKKVVAERDVGDVIEEVEAPYPVLVTVTKEINEPRLPNLMQIMGAGSKPVEQWNAAALEVDDAILGETGVKTKIMDVIGLSMERKNIIFSDEPEESAQKLVDALVKEGIAK